MNETNRNMILAIVLSVVVLFGWQFFIAGPQMERAQRQAEIAAQQAAAANPGLATTTTTTNADGTTTTTTAATPTTAAAGTFADRAAALAASPRVEIETAALKGTINLAGGRLDDLQLKKYTETLAADSAIITLLTPSGAPGGYYVEQGWAAASGSTVKLPDATSQWTLEGDASARLTETTPVTIKWDNGAGLIFRRSFAVDADYLFTVTQSIENASGGDVALFPYARAVREGTPAVQNFFVQHEGPVGVLGSNNQIAKKYTDLQGDKQIRLDNTTGWLGFTDKYWATAVIANPGETVNAQFTYLKPNNKDEYQTSFVGTNPVTVASGATAENKSYVFAGAKEEAVIASYETQYHFDRLELLIDWGWFFFLTKPMFYLIRFLYGIIGNFGLAMLAVTVIVKGLFFPLASRSYASMAAMRRVQPEMKTIQERFKEDRPAQQQAMMELYKREKINPLSGCWPVLIQIPVFFSLYTVLFISLEMRHAPFFGWIQDLAAQDPTNIFTLFGLLPIANETLLAVPLIGGLLHLGIWPLIMGVTMWVQMRLNPPPPDPTQAMIFNWMPVVFTFMLGTFPAGLVIYWSWNN
ncbi:MAG: membrane protein insertase YidC, partial [Devosia sp.]|nr:membrane protein insertase YidC [Devosia sp.]